MSWTAPNLAHHEVVRTGSATGLTTTTGQNATAPSGAEHAVSVLGAAIRAARDLADRSLGANAESPAPGSPRATETLETRREGDRYGHTRALLIDETISLCQMLNTHLRLLTKSVTDCFIAATTRDGSISGPGLAAACRPVTELAALITWLLEESIGADERGRRLLVLHLHELRLARDEIDPNDGAADSGRQNLAAVATKTRTLAAEAGWRTTPASTKKGKLIDAALLAIDSDKTVSMPSPSALADRFVPGTYGLLSSIVHPGVLVLRAGTELTGGGIRAAGIGLFPQHALGIVAWALNASDGALGRWYGLDDSLLTGALERLTAMSWVEGTSND